MKKTRKITATRKRLPDRSSELLVNQRMLYAVRDELKSEILSHERRFDSIDARFDSIEAKIDTLGEKLSAEIHRVIALAEEQNNRNYAVLDGYQSLFDRQERLEQEHEKFTQTVLDLKKISR